MTSVSLCHHLGGGRHGLLAAMQLVSPTLAKRNSSFDVKFLTKIESSDLKRGRGGRSSFSGIVATIFGSTGFTGRYIVNRLGKTGTQMILPYRCDQYDTRHLKVAGDLGQILFMPFDSIKDEAAIKKAMKHSQVVINLIGREHETKNYSFEQANVDSARMIAKCAKEMGIERLIHISALNSTQEYEGYILPGGSQYLKSKAESEVAVREEFPDAIIFRPSDIWGQGDTFLSYYGSYHRRTLKMISIPHKGKGIWKQPVSVSDFAQGVVNAITSPEAPGTTYEIIGPRRYELIELVEYFHRVMRRDEDWGHKVLDLKFDPFYKNRVKLHEKLPVRPLGGVSIDKIEREAISDTVLGLPNLDDLGVELTKLEDVISWELKPFRAYGYYDDALGEFKDPEPPKYITAS